MLAAGDPDQQWIGAAIERYLREAPAGLNLDAAVGVSVTAGSTPWWRQSQYAERDRLLVEIAATLPGSTSARAEMLQQLLRRYAASSWPRDRCSGTPTAANVKLYAVFMVGANPPLSVRRLTEILSQ